MSTTNKSRRTAEAWKKARVHAGLTLPSGTTVDVEIPNLPKMLKSGTMPNELIDVALEYQNEERVTREMMEQTWDFIKFIVPLTVKDPEITGDDVEDLPIADVEMIASWATRSSDFDAIGHHLGGLEKSEDFRNFRGITTIDEALSRLS
jgi:hypothetical protein